ncbi:DUF1642 domain-containing protein [Listeria kieliensis]
MKFKKGDRVKHKEYDLTGVVESTMYGTSPMLSSTIQLSGVDGEDNWLRESEFEKIEVPKVPKWFHEAYKFVLKHSISGVKAKEDMIYYISRCGYGHRFHVDNAVFEDGKERSEHTEYVNEHKIELIRAILEGYEVEQEPLYEVVLFKDDYVRLLLTKQGNSSYRPEYDVENEGYWKQKLTKDEIEEASELHGVDYMKIAKKVEEVKK